MTEANAPAYVKHREYLLVTVPPANGVREFYLLDSHNNHKTTQGLFWKDNTPSPPWILLPPGSWQLIGLGSELTEEQWREIVQQWASNMPGTFRNYEWPKPSTEHYFFTSAINSGLSLLRSHNLNPHTTIFLIQIQP